MVKISPLTPKEWSEEQRQEFERIYGMDVYRIFGTIARHPQAYKNLMPWAKHFVGGGSELPVMDQEVLILRVAHLKGAAYVWRQHAGIGLNNGLTDDDIEAIKRGNSDKQNLQQLISVATKMCESCQIPDNLKAELSKRYSLKQYMDIVFTIGHYNQVAMICGGFGID